jgi:hypothetical protein
LRQHASPGLEIASFGFDAVAKYLEHDGNWSGEFEDAKFDPKRIEKAFGVDALQQTNIDFGDVMVFTCWTFHRTVHARERDGRSNEHRGENSFGHSSGGKSLICIGGGPTVS